jgi:hypothetical protein
MLEIEKNDCTDSLTCGLNRTKNWRQKMAIRYPLDPRNARAAECLAALANEAPGLTDKDWKRLQPHCGGWANEPWREAISQAARNVGFRRKIKDLPSFVDHLLEVLSQSSIAA